MQTVPKISVVIPTYNYANFLGEAIQSVLDQTFTDFELIIVDNCSTDNTDEVVTKYLSDSRVSYYKNDTNLGLVGNWNKCLEYARGEYIKFLCADDKFRPQLLEKYVAVMDTHPNLALLSAYNEIFGARSLCRISPFKGYVHAPLVIEDLLGRNNRLRSPSVCMFRKQHAEQAGRFNPKLHQYADRDYYIRLLAFGDCYFLPEPLCFARTHPGTQSALVRKKKHGVVFERYWLMVSVKTAGITEKYSMLPNIDAEIKRRAVRCAAVMYELLPKLYKPVNRVTFKKAYQIGRLEGVLLSPVSYYLK